MKRLMVTGMPRSGTSWLGQIINSSPSVLFRTEPIFSYRFKNFLNVQSKPEAFVDLFERLIDVDDDFILQKDKLGNGYYPDFQKQCSTVVGFKTTRNFELLRCYLEYVDNLDVVAIVRHPCAVIYSWFKSYREFEKKGCKQCDDWRSGKCRKDSVGEYWGFDDWIMSTKLFLTLEKECSNFHIIRYSDLVNDTESNVRDLFLSIGLDFSRQTHDFIESCHQRHDNDPYSVFKDKASLNSWEMYLDDQIKRVILQETEDAGLKWFLDV